MKNTGRPLETGVNLVVQPCLETQGSCVSYTSYDKVLSSWYGFISWETYPKLRFYGGSRSHVRREEVRFVDNRLRQHWVFS